MRECGRRRRSRVGRVGSGLLRMPQRMVVVVIMLLVRMRPRHVVGCQRWEVASGVVHAMRIVGMMPRAVVVRSEAVVALDLLGGIGKNTNIHVVARKRTAAHASAVVQRSLGECILRIRVRRRHVWRDECRVGRTLDRSWSSGRRHHRVRSQSRSHVVRSLRVLISSPRVRVVVYPRVSSELVRAGELLAATRELAGMWLLTRVRPDMPRLVLQTVESLIAERALVWPWELTRVLLRLTTWERSVGPDNAHCSHVYVSVLIHGRWGD